jgi:hypothetical protein
MSQVRRVAIDAPNRLVIDGFVDVLVVDQEQKPIAGVLCELVLPDSTVRLQLSDGRGIARFPRVPLSHRSCTVRIQPRLPLEGETGHVDADETLQRDDDVEDLDEDTKQMEQVADEADDSDLACAAPTDDGSEPDGLEDEDDS